MGVCHHENLAEALGDENDSDKALRGKLDSVSILKGFLHYIRR